MLHSIYSFRPVHLLLSLGFMITIAILYSVMPELAYAASADNYLVITEEEGKDLFNYPLRIGRPAEKGEFPENVYPQMLFNGSPLKTQVNVKNRWPDGSVKFSILSVIIPEIKANSSNLVSFQNQFNPHDSGELDQTGMLSGVFNFDGVIELKQAANTKTVSAREMLQAGAFSYWAKGSVATSIILADHSKTRQFDRGFDNHRSFRPIFHATFWPDINEVEVRFIGEVANTVALQDMQYDLTLRHKGGAPALYTYNGLYHNGMKRWNRRFRINAKGQMLPYGPWTEKLEPISVDHNLDYLKATYLVSNYDTTKKVSEGEILKRYNKWLGSGKHIGEPGRWLKNMEESGGRPDIGPIPTWYTQFLYTGDRRMATITMSQADQADWWPLFLREGDENRRFLLDDPAGAKTGMGRVLSLVDRSTLCGKCGATYPGFGWGYTTPADKINLVGNVSQGSWEADGAHQPDAYSIPYLLSGDHYYLENMYFWASFTAFWHHPFDQRGRQGRGGGITGFQGDGPRVWAWEGRSRGRTGILAPDDSMEKKYFTRMMEDAIAQAEGERGIKGTQFENTEMWNYGFNSIKNKWKGYGIPPLHSWGFEAFNNSGKPEVNYPVDYSKGKAIIATWMEGFTMFTLNHLRELDYPAEALTAWLGEHFIDILTDPQSNPYYIASYREPTVLHATDNYCQNYAEWLDAFDPTWDAKAKFLSDGGLGEHGYSLIALPAAAGAAHLPGGEEAWKWMKENALTFPALNDNPKWAIIPREGGPSSTLPVSLSVDVDTIPIDASYDVILTLDAGPKNAGRLYQMLGSSSGSKPGFVVDMALVPINWDSLTNVIANNTNSNIFQNFSNVLDANGKATAILNSPSLSPNFIGTEITFAYVVGGHNKAASNAVVLTVSEGLDGKGNKKRKRKRERWTKKRKKCKLQRRLGSRIKLKKCLRERKTKRRSKISSGQGRFIDEFTR